MKTNTQILQILFFQLLAISSFAQHTNIEIGNSIAFGEPSEPSICINPSNTNEIIIGTMTDHYYFSTNGGTNWQKGTITSSYGILGDPVIVSDDNGSFYYFHLIPDMNRIVCQKKEDINSSWSNGSYTGLNGTKEVDKEWATFDPTTGNIYLSWTEFDTWGSTNSNDSSFIYLSKSTDKGLTWSNHKLISNIGGNATGGFSSVHGSMPATGPNGEVYVAWWSRDGIMFDKSVDQGETWLSEDIEVLGYHVYWIYSIPGIETGVSFPVISCDRSGGQNHGTIYINWADKSNGNSDIWIVKSTDAGATWSDPKLVNDDNSGKHQFFNFMTIDQVTGKIYVIFYDRRNYSDSNTDVYMALSEDGGETFANFKISEAPFYPYSTVFFGHYIGVSVHNNNIFATWTRMDDGQMSLWGTKIETSMIGIDEYSALPFSLDQNTPNPFNETTFISFKIREPSKISLLIYDIYGNKVTTLINNQLFGRGKYIKRFDPAYFHTTPGIYYFSLMIGNQVLTKKMIIIN